MPNAVRRSELNYEVIALRAITDAGVPKLVGAGSPDVVVLERLASSAGATNWYVLHEIRQLNELATRLSPGSSLSFYFDGPLALGEYDSNIANEIIRIARRDHDAVVGKLSSDGMTLEVDFIADQSELDEFMDAVAHGTRIFYGAFPARDNDGVNAVTIDLPDADGVVRQHPH